MPSLDLQKCFCGMFHLLVLLQGLVWGHPEQIALTLLDTAASPARPAAKLQQSVDLVAGPQGGHSSLADPDL